MLGTQLSLLPETKIYEANAIARAQWRTSNVWVQRVVAKLIQGINLEETELRPHKFSVYEITGYKSGKASTLVRSMLRELASQVVILTDPKSGDMTAHHVFKDGILYSAGSRSLEVCLNSALKPYYLALQRNFTAYKLDEFLSLPGTSYQSLYKYLKSWESEPGTSEKIEELHRILNSPAYIQEHYGRFDQKVLAPAHKFINERTSLKYDYEPERNGRKVVEVHFKIHSEPEYKKAPPPTKTKGHKS